MTNQNFLGGGKSAISHLLEVLYSQKGIPKDLKKSQKFQRGGGVNNCGIWMVWRVEYFGMSKSRGGKMFMLAMVRYGYFLESP